MLTELCHELKNWFTKSEKDIVAKTFTIQDGIITPTIDIKENQYYRIVGSLYNDGVHQFNDSDVLIDEEFDGAIWLMYVPQEVIALSNEIDTWNSTNSKILNNPYTSEKFGGYQYTKKTGAGDKVSYTWKDHFSDRLNRWRKL